MTKQPEALRLADLFESDYKVDTIDFYDLLNAASELRCLYAANQELLEILKAILNDGLHCAVAPYLHRKALAAIEKATGETE